MTQIADTVLAVLSGLEIDGNAVRIRQQLDRKLYVEVNKVLEALGGKWDRKAKAHLFLDSDPADEIDAVVVSGAYLDRKKVYQFFETPDDLADRMVDEAEISPFHSVLEPSAGHGKIVRAIWRRYPGHSVSMVELDPKNCERLTGLADVEGAGNTFVLEGDFLTGMRSPKWGRILMNPPFTRLQDVDHVTHAFNLLRPGGRVVAIVSESPFFRQEAKAAAFRGLVMACGRSEQLPGDAFRESGTMVRTRLVVLDKET